MKRSKQAWITTEDARVKREAARKIAQQRANESGLDFAIEANELFKEFSVFSLPCRESRCGYELRVECVMPMDLSKCLPGHGPCA